MEMSLDGGFGQWWMFEEGVASQAREGGKEARLNCLMEGRQCGAEEGRMVKAHASCSGGLADGAVKSWLQGWWRD